MLIKDLPGETFHSVVKLQAVSDSYRQHMYISVVIKANMEAEAVVFNKFYLQQSRQSYYIPLLP